MRQYSAMTPERGEFDAPHWSNLEASSEEVGMASARFVKTGITADEYDQMREKLGVGDAPPAGACFTPPRSAKTERFESLRYGTRVNRLRPGARR